MTTKSAVRKARQSATPRAFPSTLSRHDKTVKKLPAPLQCAALMLEEPASDPSTPVEHKAISVPPPPPPNCDPTKMIISDRSFVDSKCNDFSAGKVTGVDISCGVVPIHVDDVVAYEYIDNCRRWRWGLATVVALPAPWVVQLLLWRSDGELLLSSSRYCNGQHSSHAHNLASDYTADVGIKSCHSPDSISKHRRQLLMHQLERLKEERDYVQEAMDGLVRRLAVHRLTYRTQRQRVQDAATAAEHLLAEAQARVKSINQRDWREIRCYRNPPAIVRLVVEAVFAVLGEHDCGKWRWSRLQKAMRRSSFLHAVERFKPCHLSESAKQHIRKKFMEDSRFTYEAAVKGSQALGYLEQWVVVQVESAAAKEGLAAYDEAHGKERGAIVMLEGEVNALRDKLDQYMKEEENIQTALHRVTGEFPNNFSEVGDGDDTTSSAVDAGFGVTDGWDGCGCGDVNGGSALNCDDCSGCFINCDNVRVMEGTPRDVVSASVAIDVCKGHIVNNINSALREDAGCVQEAGAVWTGTEELLLVLRTTILCNFNRAEQTIIHLTHEQMSALGEALRRRGHSLINNSWEVDRRAGEMERDLQDALEELRGHHGRTLHDLRELEIENYELTRKLERREQELDKLNRAIQDGIGLFCTPRGSQLGSTRGTPRSYEMDGRMSTTGNGSNVSNRSRRWNSSTHFLSTAVSCADEAQSNRLSPADQRDASKATASTTSSRPLPTAAYVQLLEDDLRFVQEELQRSKDELNNFRKMVTPGYYTSTALWLDRESVMEVQAKKIAALVEALAHSDEGRRHVEERMMTEHRQLMARMEALQRDMEQQRGAGKNSLPIPQNV
ncbi:dynein heavy chain [Trypanosoma brucei equiperdum]|uniref:Dynein heavy chain n=1 Tax=Trypanosoma brucei equiperdum TaxID=630700 RepID=A0A3L6L8Q7_9TRYP|nr:dynein heavy chain [Trypanosoma brucei equiperdum]